MRSGGRVEREHFTESQDALDAVKARAEMLVEGAPRRSIDLRYKKLDPVQQVFVRLELSGPERLFASIRAGIDIRGDGSMEPYTGRFMRRAIARRSGESAVAALRRVVREAS